MKRCFKCGVIKDLHLFYVHKYMADGYLGKCKLCTKKDVKERYESPEGNEKIRMYESIRNKTENRKSKRLEYQRKNRSTKPGKYRARAIISNYIRDGKLVRCQCEVCGNDKAEAHHTDYRKPLQINWLCFKHHREKHGQKV